MAVGVFMLLFWLGFRRIEVPEPKLVAVVLKPRIPPPPSVWKSQRH